MLPVPPSLSGIVCQQVQQQTTTVCVTGARLPGLGSGCTQSVLEGLDKYAFPESACLATRVTAIKE